MKMMMTIIRLASLSCGRPLQGCEMCSHKLRMFSHDVLSPVIEESGHPCYGQEAPVVCFIGLLGSVYFPKSLQMQARPTTKICSPSSASLEYVMFPKRSPSVPWMVRVWAAWIVPDCSLGYPLFLCLNVPCFSLNVPCFCFWLQVGSDEEPRLRERVRLSHCPRQHLRLSGRH